VQGAPYEGRDEGWVARDLAGVPPPREYTHILGAVVAALAEVGLHLFALDEHTGSVDSAPGTWAHLKSVLPPWFTL